MGLKPPKGPRGMNLVSAQVQTDSMIRKQKSVTLSRFVNLSWIQIQCSIISRSVSHTMRWVNQFCHNFVFVTNSNFLAPKILQHDGVHVWYFKLDIGISILEFVAKFLSMNLSPLNKSWNIKIILSMIF